MTADSDDAWALLPADAQCAHPGELAMLGKRELPPPPSPAKAELAPTPPAASPPAVPAKVAKAAEPEDPAVLQALAALRAKIAAAPAPTSMVAEVEERHRRERLRQLRRRQQPAADLQAAVVRAPVVDSAPMAEAPPAVTTPAAVTLGATPAAPAPVAAAPAGAPIPDDSDPREDEPWFHELPDVEQQRLRRVWAEKRAAVARTASNVARNGNERLLAGVLVFVAVMLLGTRLNWHATLGAGIVCGIWWRHARADRFLDPLRAFLCLAVLQGLAMLVSGSPSPQLFMDAPLLVAFAALVGFDGEMRRTGGFDVR